MANAQPAGTRKKSQPTTTTKATTSSYVEPARQSSRKSKVKKQSSSTLVNFSPSQLLVLEPFFALAAEVDDVFDEEDAMSPEKRQMGMGRLYRSWKKWRVAVDPDYQLARDRRGS